jgi:Legionella pneumophila major outer membrane protein precursor
MDHASRFRTLLFASVSAAALTLAQPGALAAGTTIQPVQPAALNAPKGSFSVFAEGYQFGQTGKGYDFGSPLGNLSPLYGYGTALGFEYHSALSPWSFGVSVRYGKTRHKRKSAHATNTTSTTSTFKFTSPGFSTCSTSSCSTYPPITTTFTFTNYYSHTHKQPAARYSSHFIVDFTVGRDVGLGTTPAGDPIVKLEGGLRYANLRDNGELATVTAVNGATTNSVAFNGHRRFIGIGPRLGVVLSVPLGASKFTLDGTAGAVVLFGKATENRIFNNNGAVTSQSTSENRVAPGFDASVALSYLLTPKAKLSAGYQVEGYYNVFPGSSFTGPPAYTQDKDMLLYGPFLRATVQF